MQKLIYSRLYSDAPYLATALGWRPWEKLGSGVDLSLVLAIAAAVMALGSDFLFRT